MLVALLHSKNIHKEEGKKKEVQPSGLYSAQISTTNNSGISESNTFVIKGLADNWQNYSYHDRYLDALASIFAVRPPVTAITYFSDTNKYCISYNYDISKPTRENNLTRKKVELIEKVINTPSIPNEDQICKLLFLYLTYNKDFQDRLSKIKLPLFKKDNCNFNFRDKNKLADAFKEQSDLTRLNSKILEISEKLVFAIKRINSSTTPTGLEKEEIFANKKYPYENIIKKYYELLETLKGETIKPINKEKEFFKLSEIMLRPLQDVEKVLYYLEHTEKTVNIEILPHPKYPLLSGRAIHAESNLGREFVSLDTYIGVSRLSCGLCDHVLSEKYHLKHRGTHGTCDDGWKGPTLGLSNLFNKLKQQSKGIYQENSNVQLQSQHRQLSYDNLKELLEIESKTEERFEHEKYRDTLLAGEDS